MTTLELKRKLTAILGADVNGRFLDTQIGKPLPYKSCQL